MRPDSDSEARPAQCHDRPASRARRRRLEVQLEDFQFFSALRGAATCQWCNVGAGKRGTLPSVGMWGNLRCLDVHEQVSHARQFPRGPDVQLGRGDPLPRPATSLLSGENVKTLAPRSRLKPEKIAI